VTDELDFGLRRRYLLAMATLAIRKRSAQEVSHAIITAAM